MATFTPTNSNNTATVSWSPDRNDDTDFDYLIGYRLIHEGGGYIIDINNTRIFLGGGPSPDVIDLNKTVTWVPDTV